MYGKIFRQMYRGTLATVGPWEALVTFQQLIVLADQEGVVDMTIEAIVRETTIPMEIIRKGVDALEQPDPESRNPAEEGRRLVRLRDNSTWGWQIVNYNYYRKLKREEDRRDYHRQYYREKRRKRVSTVSTPSQHSQHVQPIAEAYAYAEAETDKKKTSKSTTAAAQPTEFTDLKALYPPRSGGNPWPRALKACLARIREGSTWSELLEGTRRYQSYCSAAHKIGTEYVMQAATFFGPDKRYLETWAYTSGVGAVRDSNIAASQQWLKGKRHAAG
jgi:hypothetical protein